MGAPGFMTYWLAVAVFLLEYSATFAPQLSALSLLVLQIDFAMIFNNSQAKMQQQFPSFARRLAPAGILWVSWPKKTSGMVTDLNENDVRRIGLLAGLVDVKVCAVSEVWSGLKFVIRVKDRPSSPEPKKSG